MAQDTKWSLHDNVWHFSVTDPHLHPKGFTIYKVTCKTCPIRSPETLTEVACWKRYNNFKILHKSLLALHKALHRRDQFPEFAKPKLFGRFDDNVVEERRLSALELLNFIATQPHLYKSLVFKQFLEEGRIQSHSRQEESLMIPRPSNLDITSSGLSDDPNPTTDPKMDVQQDSKNEIYISSLGKPVRKTKEHAASLVSGSGDSQNSNTGSAMLEGTWNFPQVADNISLSSSTGDDTIDTDDESLLASSLPDTDLAYFDPIGHDSSVVGVDDNSGNIPRSNSWLLEGLNICAVMESEVVDDYSQGDVEVEAVSTPMAAESSNDCNDTILSTTATKILTSSPTLEKVSSDPSSPASSGRKGSSGSGTATSGKSIDLTEFDPIRRMSECSDSSKVECGKGDLDLSVEWQRSASVASDISVGSHASLNSSLKQVQDTALSENDHKPTFDVPFRSRSVGSDKSQDSEKASSNKSTPMRSSRSLLKRLVSGSPGSHKPRSVTEQIESSMDISGKEDYIYLAASQISMAQNSEVNGDYEVAFAYYKSGVGILLQGVQGDTNQSRRDAVRRKTAQYLMKAEDLFNRYLANENCDERRWGADSFLSPSLDLDPSFAFIRGSVRELRNFQVLGVIDKVILVRDKMTDETFVIKSIAKSTPDAVRTQSILPTSCPHMVSLHKFYETDDSVFLLLQYASGGKLWMYIGDYLNIDRANQANGNINMNAVGTNINIYSGTKVETAEKDEKYQDNHASSSSVSNMKGALIKEQDLGSIGNECRSKDASESCVQSTGITDVVRFSTLKEDTELYSVEELIKESSHNESFDDDNVADVSESHDMFNDSDLNDVLKNTYKKNSFSRRLSGFSDDYASINEVESSVISPIIAPDEDHFQTLLQENRGNLEAFSINSFDSEDTHRNSLSLHEKISSTSEHSENVPSKHTTSRQISADEVFTLTRRETQSVNLEDKVRHASTDGVFSQNTANMFASTFNSDDLIRNSKELLQQVEKVLAETNDRSGENNRNSSMESSPNNAEAKPCLSSSNGVTEEPSIYDVNKSSEDDTSNKSDKNHHSPVSSDTLSLSPIHTSSTSDSLNDVTVRTEKNNVGTLDSKGSAISEETEHPALKTSENDSPKHQPVTTVSNTSSRFRQASTPRKLSLNRMSSKDMTRSASFECDLKSPTRNRARAVSDLFERLDSTNTEQVRIPESSIKKWMAQLVTAVSRLHSLGIICRDLKPSNVLLGDGGQVYLSYFCSLGHGDPELDWDAIDNLYAAPEVGSVNGYDKSCDWWSVGALLYELVVGRSVIECHPGGINSHTSLYVPTFVSDEARGLLEGLLRHNHNERLGARMAGSEEIKAHSFFAGIDWHALEYS